MNGHFYVKETTYEKTANHIWIAVFKIKALFLIHQILLQMYYRNVMLSLTAQFHQVFPLFLGRVEPIFADLPLGERLFPLPDTIQNPESRLREITVFSIDPVQIVHLLDQLIVQCDLCKRFSPVLFHRSFPPFYPISD